MKVLLISPKDPEKPGNLKFLMGGENTFTQSLLAHPPSGVEYIHHAQALEEGRIVYNRFQRPLSFLMKVGILPLDVGFQCFEIRDKFDLIHLHVYCSKLINYAGPVVLSDSSSNFLFLRDYLGWGRARIRVSYALRKFLFQKLGVYDPNLNLKAAPLVIWSEFAKRVHQDLGGDPGKMVVIPPGIAKLGAKKVKHSGFNILFVGIWFARKGGPLLLEAYKILKKKYRNIHLFLIGEVPQRIRLPRNVWHKDYLPREELINKIFPQADVLVLVSPVAEGYGLVVLEAASLGIPAIVTSVYALPEIVKDKETGFVIPPSNLDLLVDRLERLIKDKSLSQKMGEAAQKRFMEKFWIKKTNQQLLRVYQESI